MIALRVQMGIVMRNVKMYCICDDKNMTKCNAPVLIGSTLLIICNQII